MLTNCAGPPAGKLVNWFLDSEMWVRFSSELRSPSGRLEMRLFSTLNCSSAVQLASEPGMESDCGQSLSQYLAIFCPISHVNCAENLEIMPRNGKECQKMFRK